MYNTFKHKFFQYLIFAALTLFIFLLCAGLTMLVRGRWNSSLSIDVQKVLDAVYPGTCVVSEKIDLQIPGSVSAAAFSIIPADTHKSKKSHDEAAVILRVTGLLGPVPVVFIYNTAAGARFAGISGFRKPSVNFERYGISKTLISHWTTYINSIFAGESHENR